MQARILHIKVKRVDAVSSDDLSSQSKFIPRLPIAATWLSHLAAMKEFLDSDLEYGLILEDDFHVSRGNYLKFREILVNSGFDFLQLGWVYPHYLDYLTAKVLNFQDLFFKFVVKARLGIFLPKFRGMVSVQEQENIETSFVLNDIRAGAHAYLVSRRFAETCLTINNPIFLSADGVFMALGTSRNFRMARTRRNLFLQSGSPSSINVKEGQQG